MGAPPEMREEFAKFDAVDARLEDFLDENVRPVARIVLLDAIRVSRADGFAEKERALAKRGARRLGIEESWVDAMEAQLVVEDAIREARVLALAAHR
jgi:tellurite resistance protein